MEGTTRHAARGLVGALTCRGAGLCAVDAEEGGLLCRQHRRGSALTPESVRLLQLILGGQLNVALAEPPSAACTWWKRMSWFVVAA